jgi:hypothetical protein
MSLGTRLKLYAAMEKHRGRPLIVFVTGDRQHAQAGIAADAVRELLLQLQELPKEADDLDLLIVSLGGDPTVAWRIVSLIRERVGKFNVLVPQAAYSAATLIALGADEIVMHPHGNLGPTDPQIQAPKRKGAEGTADVIRFGSEDLGAFLRFAREEVGLSDQEYLAEAFEKFCEEVGAVPIGVAARSSQLSLSMGEKLLQLHMTEETERQKAQAIAQALTKDFFHHGYPVNRSEAKQIGLKIADSDEGVEKLLWEIWADLSSEMQLRDAFLPMRILHDNPACADLFSAAPQVSIPPNLPADILQQVVNQVLAQTQIKFVPPTDYEKIQAVMESRRCASRFVTKGQIYGSRTPDLQFKVSNVELSQGWVSVPIEEGQAASPTGGAKKAKKSKSARKKRRVSATRASKKAKSAKKKA